MGKHDVRRPVLAASRWAQNFMLFAAMAGLGFVVWDHLDFTVAAETPAWIQVHDGAETPGWVPTSVLKYVSLTG